MVAQIQQMGDGATTSDTTDVIVDTSQDHKDIRISDGEQVLKITLDQNYEIQTVFQNDVVISDPGPQNQD
jgi:hypothetical protein